MNYLNMYFSKAGVTVFRYLVVQRVFCGVCGGDGREGIGGDKAERDGWGNRRVNGFLIKLFLNYEIILWIECFGTTC